MTFRIINIVISITIFLSSSLQAKDDLILTGRGPFQVRNQFPLSLQFLSFNADDAFTLVKNDFLVSLNYSHSNTFAQSPNILKNFNLSSSRIDFRHDLADKSDGSPNRFLIDTSIGRATINLKYGLSDWFTLELDLPIMGFQGGFLDQPIEAIHQLAGFPYASRAMLNSNTSQLFVSGPQTKLLYNRNDFGGYGLGDIVLMAKSGLYRSHIQGFALSARVAIKLPTGNYRNFHGSGSVDYGIDLTATKKLGRSFISTNISAVIAGKWKLMPYLQTNPSYSWILSYEYLWGDRMSLVIQNLVQSSYLGSNVHPEISRSVFEWTAGVKYDIGSQFRLSFAITENYIYHNNTADFGFHFGITRGF